MRCVSRRGHVLNEKEAAAFPRRVLTRARTFVVPPSVTKAPPEGGITNSGVPRQRGG